MKQTKITYKDTIDGFIIITKIENVSTKLEIAEEFGYKVADQYLKCPAYYFQSEVNEIIVINGMMVAPGEILTKGQFDNIIKLMKAAGNHLLRISRKNPLEKTILI